MAEVPNVLSGELLLRLNDPQLDCFHGHILPKAALEKLARVVENISNDREMGSSAKKKKDKKKDFQVSYTVVLPQVDKS